MGAWIEIDNIIEWENSLTSLLSWERGLKSSGNIAVPAAFVSLLSWERGLKFIYAQRPDAVACRSSRGSVD